MNSTIIDRDELRRIGPPLPSEASGQTLYKWLIQNFLFYTPAQWHAEILGGRITINQMIEVSPDRMLKAQDQLARVHPLSEEPRVNTHIKILYQDDDIAVVDKPAGLPMHEAGFYRRNTVRWLLPKLLGDGWCAVHRLDRETSGVLLCARNGKLREAMCALADQGNIQKTYLAVCHGVPKKNEWTEDAPILKVIHTHDAAKCTTSEDPAGQRAETKFKVVTHNDTLTLVEATPITGRTHQIRVHLAHAGHPIVGDKIYGHDPAVFAEYIRDGNTAAVQERAGHWRHLLHAWSVRFQHPVTLQKLQVASEIPTDLTRIAAQT